MICSVGLVCVDIVNFMSEYPPEDSDQRCAEQKWERGGNATNSATILALLGEKVEFLGTLADDKLLKFLKDDMDSIGIKHDNCPIIKCESGPVSLVLCSKKTGSRTITHAKGDLPELTLKDFKQLNMIDYSWMHFEGRNEYTLPHMLQLVKTYNESHPTNTNSPLKYKRSKLPVSLEIELQIDNLDVMLPLADVVLVGKDFARQQGAQNSIDAAKLVAKMVEKGTVIICPWGEDGASFVTTVENFGGLEVNKQNAFVPREILDSLGAGDTFNAIVIYCLKKGMDVDKSVKYACMMASKKLEIRGLKGLKESLQFLRQINV